MRTRTSRSIAVVMSAALLVGAFAVAPADARKKKKKKKPVVACAPAAIAAPKSDSGHAAEAVDAEVVQVTDAATEEAPVEIAYDHGPALWLSGFGVPVQEDTKFFNIQVVTNSGGPGLYVHQTWSSSSPDDMDMYLYDAATGDQVALSGSANLPEPIASNLPPQAGQDTGHMGLESISGLLAGDCMTYTVESRAFTSDGEKMVLKVWLGEPAE